MSYARFGADGSDVYVFTSDRGIECCGCLLIERRWVEEPGRPIFGGYLEQVNPDDTELYRSNAAMIEHMDRHRAAGHVVPEYVYERLRDPADAAWNERWWLEHAGEATR